MHILSPLGFLYGTIADIRNALYDRGTLASYPLGAKTISIGNITTGGTGKTPLVAYVAEVLADAGEKVCILTRGYGRENPRNRILVSDGENVLVDARTGGDEPVELGRKLFGKAIVVADADRVSAAAWAKEKFGVTAFVLDDAFQHRRAKRDLDIVCVDATDPFGKDRVLPAGRLREPAANLSRADAIVVTRSDGPPWLDAETLTAELRRRHPDSPVFKAQYKLKNANRLDLKDAFVFCGIGRPDNFFSMMKRAGVDYPDNSHKFPDHHRYRQSDIDLIVSKARSRGCTVLMTTMKDAVKLTDLRCPMPIAVAIIDVILDDPAGFHDLVLSA
jgi:tetraacyldisaccharide 4'-kinase